MKWGLWSTTAASNSATPPDGWPEGQAPSTVNDCAREMMASIRTGLNNLQFVDQGITPTQTGNTTFTLAGNQMQWYPYGNRVQVQDGANTYYGTVISASYTSVTGVTLRFDLGESIKLDSSLSAVASGFPSAVNNSLPENVYRRKNVFINGSMDVWQRANTPLSLSGTVALTYTADRWGFAASMTAAAAVTIQRMERSAGASFVPTLAQAGVFLTNSLGISVGGAMASLNAGTFAVVGQKVEGYTYRQLAQKPMALSFWVNSRQTGTYCVAIQNGAQSLSCVLPFSVSSVATWEKKTFQIPKAPSTGTWDYSNGAGLIVWITLAAGANAQGGAGNWTAANILATNAQTNFLASAGNLFMVTGLQLEEGNQFTPLEPIDVPEEINRCNRYCQTIVGNGAIQYLGFASNGTNSFFQFDLQGSMRAAPTAVFPAIGNMATGTPNGSTFTLSAASLSSANPQRVTLEFIQTGAGSLTAGQGAWLELTNAIQIVLTAEL